MTSIRETILSTASDLRSAAAGKFGFIDSTLQAYQTQILTVLTALMVIYGIVEFFRLASELQNRNHAGKKWARVRLALVTALLPTPAVYHLVLLLLGSAHGPST